jgi:pimeloyl-ACP methyl ester carboxylesterase
MTIYIEQNGQGSEVWLLLHGIGATGAVWSSLAPKLERKFGCQTIIVDLPGHGSSTRLGSYSERDVSQAVATQILDTLETGQDLFILGHSYGGTIACWLASGAFGVRPKACFGLGIKTTWSDEELESIRKFSTKPVKSFDTESEARSFYARIAGLSNASADHLHRGVLETQHGWVLANDPKVYNIDRPPIAELIAKATCPVYFARGRDDQMVDLAMLQAVLPTSVSLPCGHHTTMTDYPDHVLEWVAHSRPKN